MAKIIALVAVLCLTAVIAERQIFHYRSSAPPSSAWELTGEPDRDALISFTIALKQRNLDILEGLFWRNSDPTSPQFAQHLTHDEVLNIVAPAPDVHSKIMQWIKKVSEATLATGGHIEELENLGDAIAIRANVHFIEELFETKLYKFEAEGRTVVKHLGQLSVPAELVQYIDLITGITEFAPTNVHLKKTSKRTPADDDNQCNVPYNLKNLYNVPQTLTVTNPNANISIFAVGSIGSPEGFGFSSVTYWEKINGLPNNPITCIIGDGASNITPNDTDGEAQLDTQMVTGMAVNAKACFWIIDGWMYDFTQNIFHTPNSPLVVSMSYAWLEWEQCDNLTDGVTFVGNCTALHIPNSAGYVNRTNVEFQKLGLVGHTLVAAAGDDGTAGNHGSPNGCTKMAPLFPAASPYVLSVGATSIEASSVSKKNPLGGSPPVCTNATYLCVCSTSQNEQVASQSNTAEFDTGGGFSLYTPRPSYQDSAVTGYLKSGVTLPSSQFGWNQNGRGYPDIGAVGENFCVVDKGSSCSLVAGTSASAPLISSLITLFNNDRLNAGKTPLGFINPTIYAMYNADSQKYFNNQFDTQTNGGECGGSFGFTQMAGMWSPLVGVGSPKFDQMRTYINTLP